MSNDPVTVPKYLDLPKSMDYKLLKQEGIDHAQQLAGDIWTDFNEHDPGVTILENLCYVLSELGYKTSFDVEDLFFAKAEKPFDVKSNALYSPEDIFPCSPLTILDYRKLLIDRMRTVQNAWVIPKLKSKLGIDVTGLYKVLLQVDYRNAKSDEDRDRLKANTVAEASRLLNGHRNLSEDFDEVEVLQSEKISIVCNISISANSVGESVLARIIYALTESLTPQVRFHTLDDLMDLDVPLNEIFDGPPPIHGFISSEDLTNSELHILNTIHKSRLIKIISEVEGVNKVTNFKILIEGEEVKGEIVRLPENKFPELDIDHLLKHNGQENRDGVRLYIEDEIGYKVDEDTARYEFEMLVARYKQRYLRPLNIKFPQPGSQVEAKDLEYFFPVQNSFPKTYGIGEFGLPARASKERKAQAKQLKAYLMFYEQLMANYLSQLVNVRHLFSIDRDIDRTYFHQNLFHIPNVEELLQGKPAGFSENLEALIEEFDPFQKRRNRFLDHMLARFGEEFMTDSYHTLNRQASMLSKREFQYNVINAKTKFLRNYIELSRYRGKGLDTSAISFNSDNVSGLKKRTSLIFNISDYSNRLLSGLATDPSMTFERSRKGEGAKKKFKEDIFRYQSSDREMISEVLTHGLNRDYYSIKKSKDGKLFQVWFQFPEKKEEPVIIYQSKDEAVCEEAVSKLIDHLKKTNHQSEGFHMVEHILLRPVVEPKIGFYISDNNLKLLQTDYIYDDEKEEKRKLVALIKKYGTDEKNYKTETLKSGGFAIYLKDKDGNIIAHNKGVLLKKSLKPTIKQIAGFVQKLSEKRNGISSKLKSEDPVIKGAMMADDPYSLQISVVLPSWPARFQNPKLRTVFENIMKLNAPAHVSLECFWVNIPAMQEFERIYQAWLREKSRSAPRQPRLDDLSYFLLLLIKNYDDPTQEIVMQELPKLQERADELTEA